MQHQCDKTSFMTLQTATNATPTPGSAEPHPAPAPAHQRPASATLHVLPWLDPVSDSQGHNPLSLYVEFFWLPVLGPTSIFLLRRLALMLDESPQGLALSQHQLANEIGLGKWQGENSPLNRSIIRCHKFKLALFTKGLPPKPRSAKHIDMHPGDTHINTHPDMHPTPQPAKAALRPTQPAKSALQPTQPTLYVRRFIPEVSSRLLGKLPKRLQILHRSWHQQTQTPDPQHQSRHLALALLESGNTPANAEQQLLEWNFHPALISDSLSWARSHQTKNLPT